MLRRRFLALMPLSAFMPLAAFSEGKPNASSIVVRPSDFGAVGDGVADDTAAVQASIDAAVKRGVGLEFDLGVVYAVSSLKIPDADFAIDGRFSTLRRLRGVVGGAILASEKWIRNVAEAQRPIKVMNLTLVGGGEADFGWIVQSWNSRFYGVHVSGCKSAGMVLTAVTKDGSKFSSSTLVNNYFEGCSFRGCKSGLLVVDPSKNKVTDVEVVRTYFYSNSDFGADIQSGGGWQFNGCHFYGNKRADLKVGFAWSGMRLSMNYFESPVALDIESGEGAVSLAGNTFFGKIKRPSLDGGRVRLQCSSNFFKDQGVADSSCQ